MNYTALLYASKVGLSLAFIAGFTSLASAQSPKSEAAADIAALLKKHDTAMNQHDLNRVIELYAKGPSTVLLGTGPGEKFQGLEEIRTAYTEIFKDFDKGSLSANCYWKDGGVLGTAAWGAAMCKVSDSLGTKKREYELNVSAVLEKQSGRWLFRMLHFSNLTGGGSATQ
jgi:uncharacterized protein (TIGR02246 family)